MIGTVFDIQRFSVHDGPGIRTTVFLKGCSLRCAWCHNPESISPKPQLQYFAERCTLCSNCARACEAGVHALGAGQHAVDREKCMLCAKCAEVCFSDALKLAGKAMSAHEVLEEVAKDRAYYANSGGGMTLSGGEPLVQHAFALELLKGAKCFGIHTALDTSAHAPYSTLAKLLKYADLVLLDLKCMDDRTHFGFTGAGKALILENARKLLKSGKKLHVRIPLIEGVSATEQNIRRTAEFLAGYDNVERVKLLPYHALGLEKAKSLGLSGRVFAPPSPGEAEAFADILEGFGLSVERGGFA